MRARIHAIVLFAVTVGVSAAQKVSPVPHPKGVGFTMMPSLPFTNALSNERLMQNYNLMQGSGVALGDFDGDGRPDIYFCSIDGTNRLFKNLGNWKFEDATAAAGLECPNWKSTGACFADLDGDGKLDLLISTLGRGVHCFMGDGHGAFRETTAEAGLSSNAGSTSLALADIDGDGDLDLFVANYGELSILRSSSGRVGLKRDGDKYIVTGPNARRLRYENGQLEEVGEPSVLYLNDGTGHFRAAPFSEHFFDEHGHPMPELWDFSLTAQIRDIDGDSFPDIYVCNDFKSPDRLWINDGKGHFRLANHAFDHQPFASMGVDFADIDRDGHLDLFVVEMLSRDHSRRLHDHNSIERNGIPQFNQNCLYWNRGDGTYAEIARLSGLEASEWSWQPVFLDVDLDGFEDLLVANGNLRDTQEIDVMARIQSLGRQPPEQSRSNIFLYPPLHTPNLAFHNRRDLTFESFGPHWGFSATNISQGIALADLDGDGDLDVVINCLNSPPLLYRNDTTTSRLAVRLRGRGKNSQAIGAKITVRGEGLPSQTQEVIAGGRYLSSDEPLRVFAATNRMSVEITWRNGNRSQFKNIEPNQILLLDEPRPAPDKTAGSF